MVDQAPRAREAVTFSTLLVTHAWEPVATEMSVEPMMEGRECAINDPLTGKTIWPMVHSFLTRARACNALFHVHPDGCQLPSVAPMDAQDVKLNTVKIHFNSVPSTINTKCMTMDLKDFYPNTPMARKEYARLRVEFIPKSFI